MNHLFKKLFNKIPKKFKKIYIVSGFIVIIIGIVLLTSPNKQVEFEYQSILKSDFIIKTEGSGYVSAENEVSIVTQTSGEIKTMLVKPGDVVTKGQIIARIDAQDESILLQKSNNDIYSSRVALNNSSQNLELITKEQDQLVANSYRTLLNSTLQADYTGGNEQGYDAPEITGTYSCDKEGQYTVKTYASAGGVSASYSGIETGTLLLTDVKRPLGKCGLFISFDQSKTKNADAEFTIEIPNKKAVNYNTNYSAYLAALRTREKNIATAQQQIRVGEVELLQSQTAYKSNQTDFERTVIRAPFNGTVGTVFTGIGEYVVSGTPLVKIISPSKIAEISLNEVDIANTKIGQKVNLTFDALNDVTLQGTVSEIDTLGSEDQNVVTFKVKIVFDNDDDRVRPGMSVTGSIITFEKKDVLLIPNTALKSENGKYYVEVLDLTSNDTKNPNKKVFITTGLSNDTETEITTGLSGDEKIVYRIIEKTEKARKGLIQPPTSEN